MLTILLAVAWRLLTPLLPFLLGGIVAYLLLPAVNLIVRYAPGRRRWPNAVRAAAAGPMLVLVIALVLGILALALSRLVTQSTALVEYAPGLVTQLQTDWRMQRFTLGNAVTVLLQYCGKRLSPLCEILRERAIRVTVALTHHWCLPTPACAIVEECPADGVSR